MRNGISFLPGPQYPAQEAAREEAYRIVLALLDILDGDAPAQALRDIAACRAAGVIHTPQHAIAEAAIRLPTWPWEEKEDIVRDRHAVLGGLIAADRDFGLVFGRPDGFLRENIPLRIACLPPEICPLRRRRKRRASCAAVRTANRPCPQPEPAASGNTRS